MFGNGGVSRSFVPFFIFFTVLTFLVRNNGFFWDSIVVGSGYAHWYYNTNFNKLFVPEEIAGYPPLFGMYMALGWKLFGKSLMVSHALMLPFLFGIVVQAQQLVKRFVKPYYVFWALLLMLVEPTFLAQATQISPDIVLVFLYLLCLNSILKGRRALLAITLILLSMLSPRGMIMVASVFVSDLIIAWFDTEENFDWNKAAKRIYAYLPAFLVACGWLLLHYQHYGWVFYNRSSEWGTGSELVGINGFLKNIAVICWRFADFGKIVPLVLLTILLLSVLRKRKANANTKLLLALTILPVLTLSGVIVFYQNPIAHRYYIVPFMLLLLLLGHLLQYFTNPKRLILYSLTLIFLLIGHFSVALHPGWLSKGWDGTLAHLPYYKLRGEMIVYLDNQKITVDKVGSAYPNLRSFELTDLNRRSERFATKDLNKQHYILYSNVFNDFTENEQEELETHWHVQKELKEGAVYFKLYAKKSFNKTASKSSP